MNFTITVDIPALDRLSAAVLALASSNMSGAQNASGASGWQMVPAKPKAEKPAKTPPAAKAEPADAKPEPTAEPADAKPEPTAEPADASGPSDIDLRTAAINYAQKNGKEALIALLEREAGVRNVSGIAAAKRGDVYTALLGKAG